MNSNIIRSSDDGNADQNRSAQRLREIVSRAIALPKDQREAYIAHASESDTALAAEARELVAAHDAAGSFMGSPTNKQASPPVAGPSDPTPPTPPTLSAPLREGPGTRVGPYKLLELIGEGGFGSVFLADQAAPVRRRVALKIIKLGMDTRGVVARFEQERQALAMMDHPHIARVLDAGSTESGRPFFVMEYVKGDPITTFADAHKLTLRERLELLTQVCLAVQHAHHKGIIHRDIKPSNVLVSMVDGRPLAKVIDFGIAKATGGGGAGGTLTDKTLFTEHRALIGTPEYMSPEQAEGSPDIDTRADVYGLGVLMYELLTGTTPFDAKRLRSAAYAEIQRIIREEEPPSPSLRMSRDIQRDVKQLADTAARRRVEPQKLNTLMRGELDWIVMKALDKDRARRFATPQDLAADIERHLRGEAVVAAPASAAYRVRKFVRRNKGAVGAGAAIAAALLIGIAGTTWGLWKAERNAHELRENMQVARRAVTDIIVKTYDIDDETLRSQMESEGLTSEEAKRSLAKARVDGFRSARLQPPPDQPKPTSSAQTSDVAALATYASIVADQLRSERDKLAAQRDAAQVGVNQMLSTITGGKSWTPIESVRFEDGRPGTDDPLAFAISIGQSIADSLVTQKEVAEWSAYTANLALAQAAMDAGNYPEARKRLADAPASKRGWEWNCLQSNAEAVVFAAHGFWTEALLDARGTLAMANRYSTARTAEATAVIEDWARQLGGAAGWTIKSSVEDPAGWTLLGASLDDKRLHSLARWHVLPSQRGLVLSDRIVAIDRPQGPAVLIDTEAGDVISSLPAFSGTLRMSQDGRVLLAHAISNVDLGGDYVAVIRSDIGPTPKDALYFPEWRDLRITAILASSPNGPSGLAITTPDGTRRIVGGSDKTVRFFEAKPAQPTAEAPAAISPAAPAAASALAAAPEAAPRELAVFRMPDAVTNLQMTGDGTRLIISLGDGSARVWDIRDPEERRKDLQTEWAERVPAGAYLDTLWASDTPDDRLRDAIINDASLTPLRRLVAVEMLEAKMTELRETIRNRIDRVVGERRYSGQSYGVLFRPSEPLRGRSLLIEMVSPASRTWPSTPRAVLERSVEAWRASDAEGVGGSKASLLATSLFYLREYREARTAIEQAIKLDEATADRVFPISILYDAIISIKLNDGERAKSQLKRGREVMVNSTAEAAWRKYTAETWRVRALAEHLVEGQVQVATREQLTGLIGGNDLEVLAEELKLLSEMPMSKP